jgi:hypothetical protein
MCLLRKTKAIPVRKAWRANHDTTCQGVSRWGSTQFPKLPNRVPHKGGPKLRYDDWSAAGLSTSDDAELQAIADRVRQAYNVGLEDV